MAFSSLIFQKDNLAQIQYKTYNIKLMAIVEAFKTWFYYLKYWKYKFFVITNHNNFC